jgi:DNA-binding IclR family transcriptional regulator
MTTEARSIDLNGAAHAVLGALGDGRWRTCAEVADEARMLPFAARSLLRQLRECGLVRRGVAGVRAGGWQITDTGAALTRPKEPGEVPL